MLSNLDTIAIFITAFCAIAGWVWINYVIIKERYYKGKESLGWFAAFNALGVALGITFLNTLHYYI